MTRQTRQIDQIRQGDVLLTRVSPPTAATRVPDVQGLRVEGERTGHAHELRAEVYATPAGRLLWLDEPRLLTHQEHAHLTVPAGWWQPTIQREYRPAATPRRRSLVD